MKKVYYNGTVYTGELPLVTAFAVEDGKFLWAGSDEEALALQDAEMIDLQGHFVCSGFIDSHMHLLNYGQALMTARLNEHTESLSDMVSYFRSFAEQKPAGWIIGRGWNHDYFTDVKRLPTRYDLDRVSTDRPVLAVRCCGHCLVANSYIIDMLGITGSEEVSGGSIGMENGKPNGVFCDNAMYLVYSAVPQPTKDELKEMIKAACAALNSYGVTGSQTDDYCVFRNIPWQTVNEAYQELENEGKLTVRVYEQSNFTTLEALKEYYAAGNNTGTGSDMFKMGPLKMLGDGSLGARTAFLSRPYADDPSTCGFPVFTQEEMCAMVGFANSVGMQVAIHAIGDGGLDYVLNAVDAALKENPRADHRHGVVHCQLSRPDQLERLEKLNMHVYAQPIFLDYDNHIVYQRAGEELSATSYAWETLRKKGVTISYGTDCPVELPNALNGIQCAVTRTTLDGSVGPYLPEEAATVKDAIDSYTKVSAYASFEENVKGEIKPGFYADFVVLDANPFEAEPSAIKNINVLETYLAGNKVY